ncbi:competence type IV pilus minor pilin ComGF [Lentibacillus salinarum]|uniref:Competence type IV pilus minor pilin ComGF n=1 Tax=Lentibacillus salinarum TaxID=446820 RepID=A0ABW3ZYH3_9BACI
MTGIVQTNSAYTATRTNENGFSFISVLFMISIIFMTIPFTTYLTTTMAFTSSYDQLSVNQFFYFLRDEVLGAADLSIEPATLTLRQPDGTATTVEQHGDLVIRRVDDTGFEVFLRQVEDVQFRPAPHGIHVSITTLNGDQFEKTIIFYE